MNDTKKSNYTPGPWIYSENDNRGALINPHIPGNPIFRGIRSTPDEDDCWHVLPSAEDARLIAAAPEMLEALSQVADHCKKVKEKARWLQAWLHETREGRSLDEVTRASIGQCLAELFTLTSGAKLPTATRTLLSKLDA